MRLRLLHPMSVVSKIAKFSRKIRPIPGSRFLIEQARHKYAARHTLNQFAPRVIENFDGDLLFGVDINSPLGSWIYWHGYHGTDELMVIDRLLRQDSVVFDIGASIGQFTLFMAKRVPHGHVVALEPANTAYQQLIENVQRNDFTNVTTLPVGAAALNLEAELYDTFFGDDIFGVSERGTASMYKGSESAQSIGTASFRSIDDIATELNLKQVDLIKLDVEGAELEALKGAEQTLKTYQPHLVVEVGAELCARAQIKPSDLFQFLEELNYEAFLIKHGAFTQSFSVNWKKRFGHLERIKKSDLPSFANLLFSPKGQINPEKFGQ